MEGNIEFFDNKNENKKNKKGKNIIIGLILIVTICTFVYVFRWAFFGLGYISIVKFGNLAQRVELSSKGQNIDQSVQEIKSSEIDLSKVNFFTVQSSPDSRGIYSSGQNKNIDSMKLGDDLSEFPECFDKNNAQKLKCSTKAGSDYILENSYGDNMQSKVLKKDRSFEKDIIFPEKVTIYSCSLLGNEGVLCQVMGKDENGKMKNTFYTYDIKNNSLDIIGDNISGAFGSIMPNGKSHIIHPNKPYAINIGCLESGVPDSGQFDLECKRMGFKIEGIKMMKDVLAVNTTDKFDIGWDEKDFYIKQYKGDKVSNITKLYKIILP